MSARTNPKTKMQIRTAYVVKGWSADKCGEEFGIHPTTIKTWASKEGWTTERDRNATMATDVVAEDLRKAIEDELALQAERADRINRVGDAIGAKLEMAVSVIADTDLRGLRSITETFSKWAEGQAKGFGSARLVRGLGPTDASVDRAEEDDERRVDQAVLVVRERKPNSDVEIA